MWFSRQTNAFPRGKSAPGHLPVAKTDAQLAAVVGPGGSDEAHHGAEVSRGLVAQGGLAVVGAITADNPIVVPLGSPGRGHKGRFWRYGPESEGV